MLYDKGTDYLKVFVFLMLELSWVTVAEGNPEQPRNFEPATVMYKLQALASTIYTNSLYYTTLYYSNLILETGHTHLAQNYQLGCPEGFWPEIKTISTLHNCQFWCTTALLIN